MFLARCRETGWWAAALVAGWAALAAIDYRARDADSRLYAEISERMAASPAAGWIAPDFPPGWYLIGPFREHPAGLFVPAATLAALGFPGAQAAYAMNAVYQVLAIVLLQRLAAALVPAAEARALGWLIQLLPIAFTFRIRANHEAAVLLCLLVALYGTERSRQHPRWSLLAAGGLVGLLLVKGLLAVLGPAVCGLWLVARRYGFGGAETPRGESDRGAWLGLAAGVGAMVATACGYEWLYRQASGEPFWSFYASRQLGVAAASGGGMGPGVLLHGLAWYLARVLWFPFPWSLALVGALWGLVARRRRRETGPPAAPGARAGALFTAATVVLYVGLFSLSDRRADRYIFPVYYAVGAAGGLVALQRVPVLGRLAARLDRPWGPAAVWAATFAAHLFAGRLGLPTIKVWAP